MSLVYHLLIALSGAFVCVLYDVSFTLIQGVHASVRGDIAYGIWVQVAAWVLFILLPLSIWLGELWFKRSFKSWLPHIVLLGALLYWSLDVFRAHPLKAALFMVCALCSVPYRFILLKLSLP